MVHGPMPTAIGTRYDTYHTMPTWLWVPWYPPHSNQPINLQLWRLLWTKVPLYLWYMIWEGNSSPSHCRLSTTMVLALWPFHHMAFWWCMHQNIHWNSMFWWHMEVELHANDIGYCTKKWSLSGWFHMEPTWKWGGNSSFPLKLEENHDSRPSLGSDPGWCHQGVMDNGQTIWPGRTNNNRP